MSRPPSPEDARLGELIGRLREQHAAAPADFADEAVPLLVAWLRRLCPKLDESLLHDAVHQTVMDLIKDASRYDPERGHPLSYLRLAARCDLWNRLRTEGRHRHLPLESVELSPGAGKYLGRDEEPLLRLMAEEARPVVPEGLTEQERQALELIRAGERKTAEFARVMGWSASPAEEQRHLVKKLKDRLNKRVERTEGRDD